MSMSARAPCHKSTRTGSGIFWTSCKCTTQSKPALSMSTSADGSMLRARRPATPPPPKKKNMSMLKHTVATAAHATLAFKAMQVVAPYNARGAKVVRLRRGQAGKALPAALGNWRASTTLLSGAVKGLLRSPR